MSPTGEEDSLFVWDCSPLVMWAPLLLLLSLGLASAEFGWKSGSQYKYEITSTSLTGIHQVADQYSGLLIKARVTVQPKSDNQLLLQIENAKYANVHKNLSNAFSTQIPEHELQYQQLPLSSKAMEIELKNGVISRLAVEQNTPQWQENFFKSIAGLFQIDTNGQNLKKSRMNLLPQGGQNFGTYKTMEDSVNGVYETQYDISPLPEFIVQNRPELAPLPHLKGDGEFINIVKSRNFSKGEQHMTYRFGADGQEGWKAGSNQMGDFLSRSSVSRIVVSGNLKRYTIQSSVTEEKVLVAPHLHNSQKGVVYGKMNATLVECNEKSESLQSIQEPKYMENLVYGSSAEMQYSRIEDSASLSSSSSSSSEESKENLLKKGPNGRSEEIQSDEAQPGINKKIKKNGSSSSEENSSSSGSSSSSSSSSSSEEYMPEQPELEQAPKIEFLTNYYGGHGSRQNNIQERIKEVAYEVGKWVQNPSGIHDEHKLAYFSLLSELVASANVEQLNQATEVLYYPKEKIEQQNDQQESQIYQAWLAFRDAVAQAGTGPALVTLRSWIESGKVSGEEAGQLISALPSAARYPTTQYMDYFFEMVKSEQVQKQRFLNTSSIISFSELVRKSQVDDEGSKIRYGVHLSKGQSGSHHGRVVRENYIPYLQSQLKNAINQGDSIKTQVYIRALGNTAHPDILAVFEPYLEGKHQVSDFQRISMIASLDEMTRVHPNTARAVLYRTYQNEGDAAEVRVAAVMQLMKTNPPAQMLQRMAQQTNYDHHHQVNAAVKSAIESAASSDESHDPQLVHNARAAANLLTTENYGADYSRNFIRSYIVKEQDQLQYKQQFAYVQGQDSIYPKSIAYNLWSQIGGYRRSPYHVSGMLSSADQLLNMLASQIAGKNQQQQQDEEEKNSFSYEKIRNLLNIQPEEQQQLEGSIRATIFGAQRFFSFDNHTIEQLPKQVSAFFQNLQKGMNIRHTKFYNQYAMEVGFPMATGHQFTFSLNVPTLWAANGHMKAEGGDNNGNNQPGINGNIQLTYSAQKRGKLGFVSQFNGQRYISAVDKQILVNLPLQGKVEYDQKENGLRANVEPLQGKSGNQKLFQYGTSVYTTQQRNDDVRPYAKNEETRKVHARPVKRYQNTVGHEASGYAVDVEVQGEQNLYGMPFIRKMSQKHDLISAFIFHEMEDSIDNSQISVTYNQAKSSPKKVSIGATYWNEQEGNEHRSSKISEKLRKVLNGRSRREGGDNMAQPTSQEHRKEELLRNAKAGIPEASAHLVDAYIKFGGEESKDSYSLTIAYGGSPVTHNSRVLVYANGKPVQPSQETKPFEAAFQMNIKGAQLPMFNYQQAINADPTTVVEGQINFAEEARSAGKISFHGELRRSEERKNFLHQHSISQVCQEQMKEGNYIQPACRNATLNAYYLDQNRIQIQYSKLPGWLQRGLEKISNFIPASWDQSSEEKTQEGQFDIKVNFEKDLSSANISLQGPTFSAKFQNIRLHQFAIPLVIPNGKHNPAQLFKQKLFEAQPAFAAVLDGNQVTTFNNKSYPVELGDCYHVFAMYTPLAANERDQQKYSEANGQRNFAVLVKNKGENKKDVKIILNNDEIALESGSGKPGVKVNGQEMGVSGNKLTRWSNQQNLMLAHSHPDNTVVISLPWNGLQVIYDTERVQLALNGTFRNKVRGLAGTFDGEQTEDFSLPDNKVQKQARSFAANYIVPDSTCAGAPSQRKAGTQAYEKRTVYGNVVSDREAGRESRSRQRQGGINSGGLFKGMKRQQSCTAYGLKVVENKGRTCFSLRPQVSCSQECMPVRSIQKTLDFHCIEQTSSDAKSFLKDIKSGSSPDFSQKESNLRLTLSLPERCEPMY